MNRQAFSIPNLPGTYAILYNCTSPFQSVVGKLGCFHFPKGCWIYVGSAFGPGGLRSRLNHHLQPSTRHHWHLDYVKKGMLPIEIWFTTDACKREHEWAKIFAGLKRATCPIPKFGATDCNCQSHLIHLTRKPGFERIKSRIHPFLEKTDAPRKAAVNLNI